MIWDGGRPDGWMPADQHVTTFTIVKEKKYNHFICMLPTKYCELTSDRLVKPVVKLWIQDSHMGEVFEAYVNEHSLWTMVMSGADQQDLLKHLFFEARNKQNSELRSRPKGYQL